VSGKFTLYAIELVNLPMDTSFCGHFSSQRVAITRHADVQSHKVLGFGIVRLGMQGLPCWHLQAVLSARNARLALRPCLT